MTAGIKVLDCTLRDGGYCNQWVFGKRNIKKCIDNLTAARLDIIECGFVSQIVKDDDDSSKYSSIEKISSYLPSLRNGIDYVAMINYGEYDVDSIPEHSTDMIDGIRVAFHKKNMKNALAFCKAIKSKGYKVFVQAMVSMAYSDKEFLELISEVNTLSPYAFYIVDSFGMMKKKDIMRYFSLAVNNLDASIIIGFHSHNNLQLAYSNAITILEIRAGRNVIIDTSVYGMGRGAGNLNTELFIDYLNSEYNSNYDLRPILTTMDVVINPFYQKNPWGYNLSNYLSAIHNAHPNYAGYFSGKNKLTIESMNEIFTQMDEDKKVEYSKEYAEDLYLKVMNVNEAKEKCKKELSNILCGKEIMLIAPGKRSLIDKEKIIEISKKKDLVCIGVNHEYQYCNTDYIFVSNNRRYRNFSDSSRKKSIVTTNIAGGNSFAQLRYKDLVNDSDVVYDDAGLMAIKMLISFHSKIVYLAGFDGYDSDDKNNYADDQLSVIKNKMLLEATNNETREQIKKYSNQISIVFVTKSKYE